MKWRIEGWKAVGLHGVPNAIREIIDELSVILFVSEAHQGVEPVPGFANLEVLILGVGEEFRKLLKERSERHPENRKQKGKGGGARLRYSMPERSEFFAAVFAIDKSWREHAHECPAGREGFGELFRPWIADVEIPNISIASVRGGVSQSLVDGLREVQEEPVHVFVRIDAGVAEEENGIVF